VSAQMDALISELRRDEGVRLKPYRCTAGKLTIGVGRNLDDVGITPEEADHLLRNDVARVCADLDARLPWWRGLDEVRQRVLVNMGFNLGIAGLLGFKNTLRSVETGDYLGAAQGMLSSKWAHQVGPRAERLALMMRDGEAAPAPRRGDQ
jgi:lysozyme